MFKSKLILAALITEIIITIVLLKPIAAGPEYCPRITNIYFTIPYSLKPEPPQTLMVIQGTNFTSNAKVYIDGNLIGSNFKDSNTIYVYFEACSAPETHSVKVVDRDAWGRWVNSKSYKACFCMQE